MAASRIHRINRRRVASYAIVHWSVLLQVRLVLATARGTTDGKFWALNVHGHRLRSRPVLLDRHQALLDRFAGACMLLLPFALKCVIKFLLQNPIQVQIKTQVCTSAHTRDHRPSTSSPSIGYMSNICMYVFLYIYIYIYRYLDILNIYKYICIYIYIHIC